MCPGANFCDNNSRGSQNYGKKMGCKHAKAMFWSDFLIQNGALCPNGNKVCHPNLETLEPSLVMISLGV